MMKPSNRDRESGTKLTIYNGPRKSSDQEIASVRVTEMKEPSIMNSAPTFRQSALGISRMCNACL